MYRSVPRTARRVDVGLLLMTHLAGWRQSIRRPSARPLAAHPCPMSWLGTGYEHEIMHQTISRGAAGDPELAPLTGAGTGPLAITTPHKAQCSLHSVHTN